MNIKQSPFKNKNVVVWLIMMVAIALHVFDEAVTAFLPFYNQVVLNLRESIGFFPMPTFSFSIWLSGLIIMIVVGFAITPAIARGKKAMKILTTTLGVLMILNACSHMIGSIYMGRLLPGFWSSPLLFVSAGLVVVCNFSRVSWDTLHSNRVSSSKDND
jgi:hypothetical protein